MVQSAIAISHSAMDEDLDRFFAELVAELDHLSSARTLCTSRVPRMTMNPDLEEFFAEQERLMALPDEDIDAYYARRADPNGSVSRYIRIFTSPT